MGLFFSSGRFLVRQFPCKTNSTPLLHSLPNGSHTGFMPYHPSKNASLSTHNPRIEDVQVEEKRQNTPNNVIIYPLPPPQNIQPKWSEIT